MTALIDGVNTLWLLQIRNGMDIRGFKSHADLAFATMMGMHVHDDFEQRIEAFVVRLQGFLADHRASQRAEKVLDGLADVKDEDQIVCQSCEGMEFSPHAVEGRAALLCKECSTTTMLEQIPDPHAKQPDFRKLLNDCVRAWQKGVDISAAMNEAEIALAR